MLSSEYNEGVGQTRENKGGVIEDVDNQIKEDWGRKRTGRVLRITNNT